MLNSESPLYVDVSEDLRRVDSVMTRLIGDRALWKEFLNDPNRIMIRLGLHPDTSPEINERTNRIFWATLTDRELLSIVSRHYESFEPTRSKELQRYFLGGLSEGCIRHDPDYDLQALNHLFEDEDVLNAVLVRALTTINNAGLTQKRHTDEDLHHYARDVAQAIKEGTPVREFPRLEEWDQFYGIGLPFGGVFFEVGATVTVGVGAEVVAYVTALLEVGFWGVAIEQSLREALEGDSEAIRRIAIVGRAMDLGAELLVHAQNFHRRMHH